MPSISSLGTIAFAGAGALGGGVLGFSHASGRQDMDNPDRLGFAASSALAGAAGGLALRSIGMRRVAGGLRTAARGARAGIKMLMANPARTLLRKMGRTEFGYSAIPKRVRGLGAIGLTAVAGVAAIAYSSRSNPQVSAYASDDQVGGTDYTPGPEHMSMKEKIGMMAASGDMVFGLNNSRHG